MLRPQDLFELTGYRHAELFAGCTYAWEALPRIEHYLERWFSTAPEPAGQASAGSRTVIEGQVSIGKGTVIEPDTYIMGPTIIGENCHIRQGAYLRGTAILGDGCIVGHATEVKNSIFLNNAHAPHFAYVGDSILGNHVNLGAGTKLANLPLFSKKDPVTQKRSTIRLRINGEEIDTGLSKFGAIFGDDSQAGCNAVVGPGCVIGPGTRIYALVLLPKGYYPPNSIIKLRQEIEIAVRV